MGNYGLPFIIRLVLLSVGNYVDSLHGPVKYTDIDYIVYTQAGIYLLYGHSPYEQEAYRYSPILAFFMIPNYLLPWFGKILFCAADVFIVQTFDDLFQNIAGDLNRIGKTLSHQPRGYICFLWSINPFSSNIASRGSTDSVSNLLLLCLIKMV